MNSIRLPVLSLAKPIKVPSIGLDPLFVPTTRFGSESGAGSHLEDEIELLGDALSAFYTPDFKVDLSPPKPYRIKAFLPLINNSLVAKPVIIPETCTKCGTCVDNCPVDGKAVNWKDGNESLPPVFDYDTCIRCYCCQELCPEQSIILKYPVFRRIVNVVSR
jgi:NAD-dependent dihydropyrimidine dehydrogenase PreA subunit